MNHHLPPLTFWSTASFGDTADTLPGELDELGQHLVQCRQPRTRWFALRCGVDALHRGLLARFITSLALVAALVGVALLIL